MNPSPSALSRRDALKIIGTGAVIASLGLTRSQAAEADAPPLGWELPKLGFGYAALEPHIDAQTMEIHYTKHHQAYITNAKKLLEPHPELLARGPVALVRELSSVPESIRTGVRNNAGGHVNHSFFWAQLAPGAGGAPTGVLADRIASTFGSFEKFQDEFAKAAMSRFGSGWAWLSAKSDGGLQIHSSANQDSPLTDGLQPVLGLDVWEHAYYLHYQNRRADYVKAFWNVVNWPAVSANLTGARGTA